MPNAAEAVAAKLASEMESWLSIELRYHMDCENKDPARPPSYPRTFDVTGHYIETAAGQRLLDERQTTDLDPNERMVQVEYSDGSKCASLIRTEIDGSPGRDQIVIKRHFYLEDSGSTGRPHQLKYLYLGLKPLPQVLPGAQHLGEGRWLDRDCDRFLFSGGQGTRDRDRIYWLDRETGITLRLEHFETQEKRAEDRPYFVWNALSLDEVAGRHLTLNSELLQYDVDGPDPHRVMMEYKITTDEAAFDREYDKSTFWPTIDEKAAVIDTIKNTSRFPKKAEQQPTAATATPIRAIEPAGWSDSASGISLLLGAAALIAGLVLWRRHA